MDDTLYLGVTPLSLVTSARPELWEPGGVRHVGAVFISGPFRFWACSLESSIASPDWLAVGS